MSVLMRRKTRCVFSLAVPALAVLVAVAPAHAQDAQDLLSLVEADSQVWANALRGTGTFLMVILFSIETWLTYGAMQLEGAGVQRFAGEMLRKLIVVSIVAMLFTWQNGQFFWNVLTAFERTGMVLTGGTVYTPSLIALQGIGLATDLVLAWSQLMVLTLDTLFGGFVNNGGTGIGVAIAMFIAFFGQLPLLIKYLLAHATLALLVVAVTWIVLMVTFFAVSAMLVWTKLKAIFVLATGPFFAGFAGFRATAGMAESYIRFALEIAINLFFLNYMASVGMRLASTVWADAIANAIIPVGNPLNMFAFPALDIARLLGVVGSVLMFGLLAWSIPGQFAKRFAGDLRIGVQAGMGAK